jgi:uncharacterized protein YjiS (DUF1127 family)
MSALITLSGPHPIGHVLAKLGASLARFGRGLAAAWRRRNDMAVLASFDDVMLKDIGLSRGDVRDAIAQPLWRDPTAVLELRRIERRSARSAALVVGPFRARGAGWHRRSAPLACPSADFSSGRSSP